MRGLFTQLQTDVDAGVYILNNFRKIVEADIDHFNEVDSSSSALENILSREDEISWPSTTYT
jgi:hypothetical protein